MLQAITIITLTFIIMFLICWLAYRAAKKQNPALFVEEADFIKFIGIIFGSVYITCLIIAFIIHIIIS